MEQVSNLFTVRAWAPFACWTAVSFRTERVSQLVPSHHAINGMMRSISGKFEIEYLTEEIHLLSNSSILSVTSNELKGDAMLTRTQRTTGFLRNVEYLFKFRMRLTKHADVNNPGELSKMKSIFVRRINQGQQHRHLYFGLKELMGYVELLEPNNQIKPLDINKNLGLCYYGQDHYGDNLDYFVPLQVVHGVVKYPTWEEVKSFGFSRPSNRNAA